MTKRLIASRGFTLIELLIALLVMSISLGALVQVYLLSVENAKRPLESVRSNFLAQIYSEELWMLPLNDPDARLKRSSCVIDGTESGEERADFDDLDDFNGSVDAPPISFGKAFGSSLDAFDNYQVSLSVSCHGPRSYFVEILVMAPSGHQQRYALVRHLEVDS